MRGAEDFYLPVGGYADRQMPAGLFYPMDDLLCAVGMARHDISVRGPYAAHMCKASCAFKPAGKLLI